MSVPDPYRQPAQPQGYPPPQPAQPAAPYPAPYPTPYGQPQQPAAYPPAPAYPYAAQPTYPQQPGYPPQPVYPQQPQYPQPQYPQQPAYPQAYGSPYPQQPQQPAYPQPTYPQPAYAQPTYPTAAPVQPAVPQVNDYQQQAFQAPVKPVVGQPVVPASPVRAAQPVPVAPQQPTPVKPASNASRPIPVTAAPVAASAATATPTKPGAARPVIVKRNADDELKALAKEEEKEEGEEEKAPDAVKAAPPWLVSLVVHLVLIILLAIFTFGIGDGKERELEVVWAEKIGEQLLDSSVLTSSPDPIDTLDTNWSDALKVVDDPLAAPPEMQLDPLVTGTTATSDIAAPSIGMALSGREVGAKKALLAAYGGTKLTEESVRAGLMWLKKNQRADGSWSLVGPYGDGSNQENATAATAMALLAYQGNGNTHRNGEFKDVVVKGWKWLLAKQNADGDFVQETVYNAKLYTQAQCTIAICELYGMTQDQQYRKPAQLAIDYAIKAQDPTGGGWRYTPRQDSDMSVTGWFVIALQSAMMSGLEVPSPQLDSISKFLDAAQHNEGAQYSYKPGQAPTLPMTAEGLLCRQYLGWKHNDPRLRAGVNYLLENKISYEEQNVYYWYYASQVLHHMGHEDWDKWNAVMREAVPKAQTQTGKEAGSWSPSNDRWGAHGGRLYTTCLSLFMLEVYYRHLPIYKHQIQ
jgi:hypothetical protein